MKLSARLALLPVAVFLVAFQVRYAMETIEARSTFLFVPFRLKPCANILGSVAWESGRDVVHPGDELLAVNGRPFTGASVYWQELRRVQRYLDAANRLPVEDAIKAVLNWPFHVTVRSGGETRTVEVHFAHCTCGSLGWLRVIWYCVLPPVICTLAGLAGVAGRPTARLAWLFLAVTVCLSQVALVPVEFFDWSQGANPLEWHDWFRIPAVALQAFFAASWPAWFLLLAVHALRQDVLSPAAWWAVMPIWLVSGLKTLIAVGWSENFRVIEPLYQTWEPATTAATVIALFAAVFVTWGGAKAWTAAAAGFAALAAALLYWPASLRASGGAPVAADLLRNPEVIGAAFTAALFLLLTAACRSARRYLAALALFLLLVPFQYGAVSTGWGLWWTGSVPQVALGSLYAGLAGFLWLLLRRAGRGGKTAVKAPAV